jgi:superfamily II DNA or RNA helicase
MSVAHVIDSSMSIDLRPYQRDALTAIEAAARRGVRRRVVCLPTGAGKTVIVAHLIFERQARTLILVHRDELIRQTLDKLAMVAQGTQSGLYAWRLCATRGRGARRTEARVLDTVCVASLHCLQRLHAPEHFLVMCRL